MLHCTFESLGSDDMPLIELCIDGQAYPFLVDTGATMSSLGRDCEVPISNSCINSVGIEGVEREYNMTPPLLVSCSLDPSIRFHHRFVYMDNCPFNLLGRDLMSRLHLSLVFSGSKLTISTPDSAPYYYSPYAPVNNCFLSATQELPSVLNTLPPMLWAEHKNDVGHVHCVPYQAKLKHDAPVFIRQYPLSEEKSRGIDDILQRLITQGVVIPCVSSYNTPVNPVPKPDGTWRFTQDLRKINEIIIPVAPVIPDVPSIIAAIPCHHSHFSVIDLCSAFFSVPVEEQTQPIFAFTHRGRQYTWTRLPQGFVDSPAVFAAVVRDALCDLSLPVDSVVLQYADDLSVSAPSARICEQASL